MKLIFCLQINIEDFFKMMLSFYLCVSRHDQITQNNNFAISLQYLKKGLRDKVDFLHVNKDESFLQIDTMILMGMVKHFQSCQYLKKEVREELDIFTCRKASKISSNSCDYFWCVWPSMPKLSKITSLLFLCNILRNEWWS